MNSFFVDLGDLGRREGRLRTSGQGSRSRCGSGPAHVERRVRGGASAGRPKQQQQQQDGAGEIEINNIFICCNIRKSTTVYVSSMPQY